MYDMQKRTLKQQTGSDFCRILCNYLEVYVATKCSFLLIVDCKLNIHVTFPL